MDKTGIEYYVRELSQRFGNLREMMGTDAASAEIERIQRSVEIFAAMLPVYEQFARLLERLTEIDPD